MQTKTYYGFQFVKIGVAKLSDQPHVYTEKGERRQVDSKLELLRPEFAEAEQSTYLVFVGEELKYVGQYTSTFESRWLYDSKNCVVWHSDKMCDHIDELLKNQYCPEISVWLTLDPYVVGPCGPLNVNKAIEQLIIEKEQPEWNNRGKLTRTTGRRVSDICHEPPGR